jgi:hypothetical protein
LSSGHLKDRPAFRDLKKCARTDGIFQNCQKHRFFALSCANQGHALYEACKVFANYRTKIFHLKHFCPIPGQKRTTTPYRAHGFYKTIEDSP